MSLHIPTRPPRLLPPPPSSVTSRHGAGCQTWARAGLSCAGRSSPPRRSGECTTGRGAPRRPPLHHCATPHLVLSSGRTPRGAQQALGVSSARGANGANWLRGGGGNGCARPRRASSCGSALRGTSSCTRAPLLRRARRSGCHRGSAAGSWRSSAGPRCPRACPTRGASPCSTRCTPTRTHSPRPRTRRACTTWPASGLPPPRPPRPGPGQIPDARSLGPSHLAGRQESPARSRDPHLPVRVEARASEGPLRNICDVGIY
mmetsp:Transcript_12464/g.31560  ORF Transcript_12464/g.31560 Transcript_12464/m.31560 type:complete len:260 (+) Transcript_12464:237-1016(+)